MGPSAHNDVLGLPRRHTISDETDFVSEREAILLGLRHEYEVNLSRHILSYEADEGLGCSSAVWLELLRSCDPVLGEAYSCCTTREIPSILRETYHHAYGCGPEAMWPLRAVA